MAERVLDKDTIVFMVTKADQALLAWATMMSELNPEDLPLDVMESCSDVANGLTNLCAQLVSHARRYGYEGPGLHDEHG